MALDVRAAATWEAVARTVEARVEALQEAATLVGAAEAAAARAEHVVAAAAGEANQLAAAAARRVSAARAAVVRAAGVPVEGQSAVAV